MEEKWERLQRRSIRASMGKQLTRQWREDRHIPSRDADLTAQGEEFGRSRLER